MRALGMDPVHDTRGCFRALVDAMSRPGTITESPTEPASYAVLATLVDHEVTLYSPDDRIKTALANEGRLTEAARDRADIVHAPDPGACPVGNLSRGSLKEPSDGATVVYRVDGLRSESEMPENGPELILSGPGVDGRQRLGVEGFTPADARALSATQNSYPRGVDAILTTERKIAALPRSVELEVA
jgi:alpha-D-ribose 1-methylphosphonate 5-triphosphate synthase subunit PhnH